MHKLNIIFFAAVLSNMAYAADVSSVSFFVSNNKDIINPQRAYERLFNTEQDKLKNTIIHIMQSNHMEQNDCEDSIGIYQIKSDGSLTADNTKIFTTSPYQVISDLKIFEIANEMVTSLNQESVGIFIPSIQAEIGNTIVYLKSHPYYLDETLKIINEKLPIDYTKAFSLHLSKKTSDFDHITINSIEWLGSKIDAKVLQSAFPSEEVGSTHGRAFLIFKNSQKEEL